MARGLDDLFYELAYELAYLDGVSSGYEAN
jgi:hypothetical protein